MRYRKFGKTDWEVSVLSFGAMRLPVENVKDQSSVDEAESIRMIRHSIDQGVNYVDTAYPYHAGKSETVVGQALRDGYRDKVKLATKMPSWFVQKFEDFDKYLDEQLARLQTEQIDFYLLHGMNKDQWPKLRDLGVIKWAETAMTNGRIGRLGFSFHDELKIFKEVLDGYDDWALAQIQYNFMDTEFQAGTAGLKYAADKGIPLVVMEPLRGGQLTRKAPEKVDKLWSRAPTQRSQADWCLRWIWDQPEVATTLSGMTTMQQLEENLASADRAKINVLSDVERSIIDQVREAYIKVSPIPCTDCKYCIPCPQKVNIPQILTLYNEGFMYDDHKRPRYFYRQIPADQQAANCEECHDCEDLCPQDFDIPLWLEKAHGWLGPKK